MGYVVNKSESGESIKWSVGDNNLVLEADATPANTNIKLDVSTSTITNLGMTTKEYIAYRIKQIISQSASQWNLVSSYKIKTNYSTSLGSVGNSTVNTLRFTSDYSYFGSGIIAITSLVYNKKSGSINSADILVNQSSFSSIELTLDPSESSQDQAYLGDVLTHEFGHFLGLAHSETIGSTMMYSIFKEQHEIHEDDIAAIQSLYSINEHSGVFTGRVLAGDNVPIFGLQVEVFSAIENKVIQSQITDENGVFYIENLPVDHSYYLKISSILNTSTLPDYYMNINNSLCAQSNFTSSFVTKCGPRSKGRPQIYILSESEDYIDVGDLSIKCDENLDSTYYSNKFAEDTNYYQLNQKNKTNFLFQGYFSADEVINATEGRGDYYTVDLSSYDTLDSTNTLKVTLNAVDHKSAYDIVVYAKRSDLSFEKYELATSGNSDKKQSHLSIELELSDDSSENIFSFVVFPVAFDSDYIYEIFSSPNLILGKKGSYTINGMVGSLSDEDFELVQTFSDYPYEDNALCVEGTVSYSAQPYVSINGIYGGESQGDSSVPGVSCGTIEDINKKGPPGGSAMSFVLGFLILIALSFINNNIHKILSKY